MKDRRITFGWAGVQPAATQSLPREVTWHPELQQLLFSPVEELEQLRGSVIGKLSSTKLTPNKATSLQLPSKAGNQSEVHVSFKRPTSSARLSVHVMVDAESGVKGTEFFVQSSFDGPAAEVLVGSGKTANQSLKLLPTDETIEMVLYVDNTFTEAFWMGGRVALLMETISSGGDDGVTVSASVDATVSATAWEVKPIWVSPEEVKQTPRLDSKVVVEA